MGIDVAVYVEENMTYPSRPPFHPAEDFPELPSSLRSAMPDPTVCPSNPVYARVRHLFFAFGLDTDSFGQARWNPLGRFIRPGMTVVLKPNWVRHESDWTNQGAMVTHSSIIRVVMDYVWLALEGDGQIIIADAPVQGADLPQIIKSSQFDQVLAFYEAELNADVKWLDLRQMRVVVDEEDHYMGAPISLPGDPLGYVDIDLRAKSFLEPISKSHARFGVADHPEGATNIYQRPGGHEYLISRTVMGADALINLPKLRSHQKGGLTCALKLFCFRWKWNFAPLELVT